MAESRWHQLLTRAEEALLARTLKGRRLERAVCDEAGVELYAAGREIDQALLDDARERGLLEELGHAAEPGTSDTELEDLFFWRKHHHDAGRH